jgi:hypothetical protein
MIQRCRIVRIKRIRIPCKISNGTIAYYNLQKQISTIGKGKEYPDETIQLTANQTQPVRQGCLLLHLQKQKIISAKIPVCLHFINGY